MRLFRARGMRAADEAAARAGIPSFDLMRAAGEAVARAVVALRPGAGRVAVLCGPGNNGGDGYVAARLLAERGRAVDVYELGVVRPGSDAERARHELERVAANLGGVGADATADGAAGTGAGPTPALVRWAGSDQTPPGAAEVVVDALFGSGLTRPLEGRGEAWVRAVNAAGVPVLAVDVPSGVRADRAGLAGEVVRAEATVQLAGAVFASALAPARGAFGAWHVADIGIPAEVLDEHAAGRLLEARDVAAALERRADETHKYLAGTVLVVGGSRRYVGAAELCARGAYRAGAGLVTVASTARAPDGWAEVIWEPLPEGGDAAATIAAVGARRAGAVVLGPGWQVDPGRAAAALGACPGPVVLDAGALLGELAPAARRHAAVVLTPHHGEAARLLRGLGHEHDADDDPVGAALALASAFGGVAVVKGAGTVIADASGRLAVSAAGSSAMATGGTGDVLAGVLGAMLAGAGGPLTAQERFDLVAAGVLLHGRAGERAAERGVGMIASEVAEALPASRLALIQEAGAAG